MAGQFIIVRSDALNDPELIKSPALFMTLCAISTMTSQNKGGWCFFKQETIAQRLGKTRQAISKSLNKLKELGYLEIKQQSYQGRQSNNLYRLTYDNDLLTVQRDVAPMPQCEVAPPAQRDVAPKRLEYIKDKKEKNALTRDEFLREISRGYQDSSFHEWDHLTETEIMSAAQACLDFYGSKGEWPSGDPVVVVRHWIRGGTKNGSIRKKPKLINAEQGGDKRNDLPPKQEWHERLEQDMDQGEFISWIRPLHWNGNGTLYAPNNFHLERVRALYLPQINSVLSGVNLAVKPQPSTQGENQCQTMH